MEKFIVYKVTFPNNKLYIGITSKTLEKRKKEHYKRVKNHSKFKFHNALRKYCKKEIWEELCYSNTWNDACEAEKILISLFDSCNGGYNSTSGGEGNYNPSPEVRFKMSSWQKGKKFSKKRRKNMSKARLGKKYGKRSEKARLNLAIGRGATPFKVFKLATNEFVGEWVNRSECARNLGIHTSYVQRCLKYPNKYKFALGYIFKPSQTGGVSF